MAEKTRIWDELKCQTKNTFVAVDVPQDSDDDNNWGILALRRQVSAPSTGSASSFGSFAAGSASISSANSATGSANGIVPASAELPGNSLSNDVAGDCFNEDEGAWEDHAMNDDQKGSVSKHPQKRPCKGQRERYRKLVQRSIDQIKDDPFNCDLALIEAQLPESVASRDMLRRKFMSRMKRILDEYQQTLGQQQQLEPNPGSSLHLTMTHLQSRAQSVVSASPAACRQLVTL